MKKIKFYSCPDCNNILCSTGETEISCCGRKLTPLTVHQADSAHQICITEIENDYYVTFQHEMIKEHSITFFAYVTYDRLLLIRLYPEQSAEVRFPKMQRGDLYACCSQHGLMKLERKNG